MRRIERNGKTMVVLVSLVVLVGACRVGVDASVTYDPALYQVSYRVVDQYGMALRFAQVNVYYADSAGAVCSYPGETWSMALSTGEDGAAVFPRGLGCDLVLGHVMHRDRQMSYLGSSPHDDYSAEEMRVPNGPFSAERTVRVFAVPPYDLTTSDEGLSIRFGDLAWPYPNQQFKQMRVSYDTNCIGIGTGASRQTSGVSEFFGGDGVLITGPLPNSTCTLSNLAVRVSFMDGSWKWGHFGPVTCDGSGCR